MDFKSKKRRFTILLGLSLILVTLILLTFIYILTPNRDDIEIKVNHEQNVYQEENIEDLPDEIKSGKRLSTNKCSGEGPVEITSFPMNPKDFAYIIPYGLTTGAHVTPIDHQYFSPTVFNSPRDTYEVYAPADGIVTEVSERTTERGVEYRMVFSHSCTFLTYYDLVTSLTGGLKDAYEKNVRNDGHAYIEYEIESGELLGYIGGQTLDFAVWNTEKPLDGFVSPELYDAEPWKLYTADPYDYYSDEIYDVMVAKNIRVDEPIAGKIDYDIEGKLIGNWFEEGTNGYAGISQPYYSGHLAIHPDHIDPDGVIVSIGDFNGEPEQFLAPDDVIHPSEVGMDTGLVKYDLMDFEYFKSDDTRWDGDSLEKNLTVNPAYQNNGCILLDLVDINRLKVEVRPNVECELIDEFDESVKYYER